MRCFRSGFSLHQLYYILLLNNKICKPGLPTSVGIEKTSYTVSWLGWSTKEPATYKSPCVTVKAYLKARNYNL